MRRTLAAVPYDRVVPPGLAVTVLAFVCGSSSVSAIDRVGGLLRWFVLVAVLVLVAAWVYVEFSRLALPSRGVWVAAAVLIVLALASSLWSVSPRLSFGRAGSLAILLALALLLAVAVTGGAQRPTRVLWGLIGGAAAAAVAGLVLLVADRGDAVVSATRTLPTRYTGLGENPDTVALLLALALPLAVGLALRASTPRQRAAAVAALLLFDGSITASRSRGALVAGFVGVFVVIAASRLPLRRLLAAAAAGAVLLGASLGGALLLEPNPDAPPPAVASPSQPHPKPRRGYFDAEAHLSLAYDIGIAVADQRIAVAPGFVGSSGRSVAWRGALDLADERPVLGYGFGTESKVFVDRYASFAGDLVESSYIGLYLQLGAFGLAAFVLLVGTLLLAAIRRWSTPWTAECAGVVAAGLVLAAVQSYFYSVGNVGTATFWICAFLVAARHAREPAP